MNESDTVVTVIAGAGGKSASPGSVVLTATSGAVVTKEAAFAYLEEGVITHMTPARGQYGTYVSIFGTNLFGGGTDVFVLKFGGVKVDVLSSSSTVIRVRVNAAVELGPGEVSIVSNTAAIVAKPDAWLYDVPSNITNACV